MYIANDRSELILSLLSRNNSISTVVDLGCNDGATLLGLSHNESLGAVDYHGVDYPTPPLISGNSKILTHACDLNGSLIEIKNILKISDLILVLDVLEHLHKPEEFLDKIRQMMKCSSQLVITVPNASSVRMLYAWLKKDFPRTDAGYFDRTHCSWFTVNSLLSMTSSKFNHKKVGYIYSKKPGLKFLQKFLPARLTSQFFILMTVK